MLESDSGRAVITFCAVDGEYAVADRKAAGQLVDWERQPGAGPRPTAEVARDVVAGPERGLGVKGDPPDPQVHLTAAQSELIDDRANLGWHPVVERFGDRQHGDGAGEIDSARGDVDGALDAQAVERVALGGPLESEPTLARRLNLHGDIPKDRRGRALGIVAVRELDGAV